MPGLAGKYHPETWDQVFGQDKIVVRLRTLAARGGLAGHACWSSGQNGTGKTTIARLIAQEVADSFLIEELNVAALTVTQLQSLEVEKQLSGWGEKSDRDDSPGRATARRTPAECSIGSRLLRPGP